MVVSVSPVHPGDCQAGWELQLTASGRHHQGGTIASLGKDKSLEAKVHFLLNEYHFCTIIK